MINAAADLLAVDTLRTLDVVAATAIAAIVARVPLRPLLHIAAGSLVAAHLLPTGTAARRALRTPFSTARFALGTPFIAAGLLGPFIATPLLGPFATATAFGPVVAATAHLAATATAAAPTLRLVALMAAAPLRLFRLALAAAALGLLRLALAAAAIAVSLRKACGADRERECARRD